MHDDGPGIVRRHRKRGILFRFGSDIRRGPVVCMGIVAHHNDQVLLHCQWVLTRASCTVAIFPRSSPTGDGPEARAFEAETR